MIGLITSEDQDFSISTRDDDQIKRIAAYKAYYEYAMLIRVHHPKESERMMNAILTELETHGKDVGDEPTFDDAIHWKIFEQAGFKTFIKMILSPFGWTLADEIYDQFGQKVHGHVFPVRIKERFRPSMNVQAFMEARMGQFMHDNGKEIYDESKSFFPDWNRRSFFEGPFAETKEEDNSIGQKDSKD